MKFLYPPRHPSQTESLGNGSCEIIKLCLKLQAQLINNQLKYNILDHPYF